MPEITEEEIARAAKAAWDAISDEHNKWNCLSLDEQDDFTRFAGALLRPAIDRAREDGWVLVPLEPLQFLLENAGPDEGASGDGWRSDKMLAAEKALEAAIRKG